MNTAYAINRFLAEYAAVIIIAAYFVWFLTKHIRGIVSEAKKEQAEYEAQYGNLEGLAEIYKRHLDGEREPTFMDYCKIGLLKYADAYRETTGKRGVPIMRLAATGAGVALLFYVVKIFVVGA